MSRGVLRQDIDEAALLYRHISQLKNPTGVEIGRFYGGSTVLIATAIGAGGRLYSIDIEPKGGDKELARVLKELKFSERVQLVVADANQYEIAEPLDFVFIDGDHSYEGARRDHNKWGRKVRKGGVIIHHDMGHSRDYATQWGDLGELYKSIVTRQKDCLEELATAGSMVVFQRTNEDWSDLPPRSDNEMVNPKGVQSKQNSYLDGSAG